MHHTIIISRTELNDNILLGITMLPITYTQYQIPNIGIYVLYSLLVVEHINIITTIMT